MSLPLWSMDTESFLISPGLAAPPLVCLQFAYDNEEPTLLHVRDPACYRELRRALETPCIWNAHNAAFDLCVIMAQYPDLIPLVFDKADRDETTCTIVRQKLLDIGRGTFKVRSKRGYALDIVAAAHKLDLGLDKLDPFRLRYGELVHTPVSQWPEAAVAYALNDVRAQRLVWHAQEAYAVSRNIPLVDQHRQARAALWIRLMEARGVMVDSARTEAYIAAVRETLEEDREVCQDAGLVRAGGTKDTKAAMAHMAELCIANEEDDIPLTDGGEDSVRAVLGLEQGSNLPRGATFMWWAAIKNDPRQIKGISLNEDAVQMYGDELLESYQRYSTSTTQLSRAERLYLAARAGVPIQASFGTLQDTGRTSCSQGDRKKEGQAPSAYGAQLQNPAKDKSVKRKQPAGFVDDPTAPGKFWFCAATNERRPQAVLRKGPRELFIFREGFLGCSTDYGGMELCAVAQVCLWTVGFSELTKVLNAGGDPHVELGAMLAQIPVAEAYACHKGERGAERKKWFGKFRQLAKIANFGFWGGMGAAKLVLQARKVYGVIMTVEEAKVLKKAFASRWTEFYPFTQWGAGQLSGEKGDEKGDLVQFKSGRKRGGCWFSALLNSTFQGFASDIKKDAFWRIAYEMYTGRRHPRAPIVAGAPDGWTPLAGSRLLIDVHDEAITELREALALEAGERVAELQRATASEWGPDVVWTCDPAWMRRWYKDAAKIVENGKAVAWEPEEKAA